MSTLPRFIWCIFDGLRRDMITPQIAPNLRAFIDAGTDFPTSRCVFPSATRVNTAAMACGATPGVTGIVANKFFDPRVFSDKLIHTGLHDHVTEAERAYDGQFVSAPSLGDVLAGQGLKLAVVSTASAGTTHLLNPRAATLGHVSLCLTNWSASKPSDYAEALLARFGPMPPAGKPNAARITRQIDMLLEAVLPEIAPDVAIVWFSDPDSTYHHCGVGSPESVAAIHHADAQFARILERRHQAPDGDQCQIMVCSDHGHLTARERILVKPLMREAGIKAGSAFTGGNLLAGSTGYSGSLRADGAGQAALGDAARWLMEQPWCGPVFTQGGDGVAGGIPGTLDAALLSLTHERSPHVYYMMRADDAVNQWGMPGSCYFNSAEVPVGGSTHGGLHALEMSNLLALGGSSFRQAYASPWAASHTDLVPTMLRLLGIAPPASMTGRALSEAFARSPVEPPPPQTVVSTSESSGRRQHLQLRHVGATTYIDRGWADAA